MTAGALARALSGALAAIGGLLGFLYVLGGAVFVWQLHNQELPAGAIVWQLPKELLLATAIKVLGWGTLLATPFLLVAAVAAWLRAELRTRGSFLVSIGMVALAAIALGAWVQAQLDLPRAIACETGGRQPAWGAYIGRTDDRTYFGEPKGAPRALNRPRRILSVPNDRLTTMLIGGDSLPDEKDLVKACKFWESTPVKTPATTSTTTAANATK